MVEMVLNRRYHDRVETSKYEYIFLTISFKIERHQVKEFATMIQTAFHLRKDILGN